MRAAANFQMDRNSAAHNTKSLMENRTMNHENDNINMVTRISNVFGKGNISKLITGAAVGFALTIGGAMPGAVRAETPLISSFDSVSFLDDALTDTGISAKVIMELSGHRNLSTTQRYIFCTDEMKRAAVEIL